MESQLLTHKKYNVYEQALHTLKDRNIVRLKLLEFPTDIQYDFKTGLFIAEMSLRDMQTNDNYEDIQYKMRDYALGHLLSYLKGKHSDSIYVAVGNIINYLITLQHIDDDFSTFDNMKRATENLKQCYKIFRKDNPNVSDIYAHLVEDIFGRDIRAFSTEKYIHYPDYKAFQDLKKFVPEGFNFRSCKMTPVKTSMNFGSMEQMIHEDNHLIGISLFNSEFKECSFGGSTYVERMVCTNGLWGTGKGDTFSVKHIGKERNFEVDVKLEVKRIAKNQEKFFEQYKELGDYDKTQLFDKWDELYELDYLTMRRDKVAELIFLGKQKKYPKNLFGLVNTLTDYQSNVNPADTGVNRKINRIVINARRISLLPTPREKREEELRKKQEREKERKELLKEKDPIVIDPNSLSLDDF